MNFKLFSALSFAAGALVGSAVTWKLLKCKYDKEYEQRYQDEIKEAKEYYKSKSKAEAVVGSEESAVQNEGTQVTKVKPDIMEYAAKIHDLGYAGEAEPKSTIRKEEDSMKDVPYVISEEEFDEAGYDTETLTYFADGVLVDWFSEPVEDVESLVGPDTLEKFDEYAEGDTVFVRNDNHMTDYEIQRDYRNYKDVFPESMED